MDKFKYALWVFCLLMISLMVGCGGSGGASATGGSVQAFASDNLNVGYDHVWVKILKVDLTNATGSANIFDESSTGGRLVDLRTLRDSTGARFLMLSTSNLPAGSYVGASVTLDKNLSIVATGSTTATAAVFEGAVGNEKVLLTTFKAPIDPSTNPKVVLDFDLEKWDLVSGVVSATGGAFVKHGDETGIENSARHEHDDYSGVVSNVAGTVPNVTFTITKGSRTLNVVTDAATVVFNNNGAQSPTISNGQKVSVLGVFDVTTKTLRATGIKIQVETENESEAAAEGIVSTFSEANSTIAATIERAKGFLPSTTSVNINVDANTRFFGDSGVQVTKSEFFALLVSGTTRVEAEGTSTSATDLLAKRVKIENVSSGNTGGGSGGGDDGHHQHSVDLKGTVSLLDPVAKTFDLTVTEWEGASLSAGKVVHVTATELPGGLAPGNHVEAKGTYTVETSTLAAVGIRLDR